MYWRYIPLPQDHVTYCIYSLNNVFFLIMNELVFHLIHPSHHKITYNSYIFLVNINHHLMLFVLMVGLQ